MNKSHQYKVSAFYQFKKVENVHEMKERVFSKAQSLHIEGTMLVAKEGINGTISGSSDSIDKFMAFLLDEAGFTAMPYKISYTNTRPFLRLKVKMKKV